MKNSCKVIFDTRAVEFKSTLEWEQTILNGEICSELNEIQEYIKTENEILDIMSETFSYFSDSKKYIYKIDPDSLKNIEIVNRVISFVGKGYFSFHSKDLKVSNIKEVIVIFDTDQKTNRKYISNVRIIENFKKEDEIIYLLNSTFQDFNNSKTGELKLNIKDSENKNIIDQIINTYFGKMNEKLAIEWIFINFDTDQKTNRKYISNIAFI